HRRDHTRGVHLALRILRHEIAPDRAHALVDPRVLARLVSPVVLMRINDGVRALFHRFGPNGDRARRIPSTRVAISFADSAPDTTHCGPRPPEARRTPRPCSSADRSARKM